MYARTTTVHARPEAVDVGIARVRDEVLPAVTAMEGCIGLSMLVDRERGRCIVTSAWRDEQALASSREAVRDMRDRTSRDMSTQPPEVQEWEIAVLHRSRPLPDGACARVSWTQVDPARVDATVDYVRATLVPQLEQVPGFCSISTLIDRGSGRSASAVTYESRDAMERARTAARDLRQGAAQAIGLNILDVAEFEVAVAHLRVPELV